jgi:Tfp pilus assembly protein PilN
MLAGEMPGLPAGNVAMLFPVRALQALPFRAASTDDALFDDMAVMHAERLGIRPDPMAGQLSDTFVVDRQAEDSVLLHVVLQNPGPSEMPPRTPQEFDISPRAYPVSGNEVCLWKELGRWVFAVHQGGKLIYCQATHSDDEEPGKDVLREIQLAVSQLMLQGLPVKPAKARVWSPAAELGGAGALEGMFAEGVVVEARPDPTLPSPPSRLLPADVRAARREKRKRQQILAAVAVVILLVLALVGTMLFGIIQDVRERNALAKKAAAVAGISEGFSDHQSRWLELGPVVEANRSPMEIMRLIQTCIPPNSGLRLKTADINLAEEMIRLDGIAQTSAPVNAFSLALKRNPALADWLQWDNTAPTKTKDGWEFKFSASPIEEEPTE